MSTKILDRLAAELEVEGWTPDTRSATEIIESELHEEEQARRAVELFERTRGERKSKLGWWILYRFNIDLSAD